MKTEVPIYVAIKDLARDYSMSKNGIRTLVEEMKESKWKKSVVYYGHVIRIKASDFEEFFRSKSYGEIK